MNLYLGPDLELNKDVQMLRNLGLEEWVTGSHSGLEHYYNTRIISLVLEEPYEFCWSRLKHLIRSTQPDIIIGKWISVEIRIGYEKIESDTYVIKSKFKVHKSYPRPKHKPKAKHFLL